MINAMFEVGGCIAMVPSVLAIMRDKRVAGLSIFSPLFFAGWGWWNIIYYPHLDQAWSAIAAAAMALINTVYLCLVFTYRTPAPLPADTTGGRK